MIDMHPPVTRYISKELAQELDNEYLTVDPLAIISSRIASLLDTPSVQDDTLPESRKAFYEALGLDRRKDILRYCSIDRERQVALDAITLRHHTAEMLLRFLHGLFTVESDRGKGKASSIWLSVSQTPTQIKIVIKEVLNFAEQNPEFLVRHYLPINAPVTDDLETACSHAERWVRYACYLLSVEDPSLNSAYNKIKHGVAVSARNDLNLGISRVGPDESGNVPLHAFSEENYAPILDGISISFLDAPRIKHKLGVELTRLRVDVPTVLAEAWIIANIHAIFFHAAASTHFNGRDNVTFAPHPGFVLGPAPDSLHGGAPLGIRSTLTLPPDGRSEPRPNCVMFYDQVLPITVD